MNSPCFRAFLEAYRAAKDMHGPRLKVAVTGENSAEISTDHADPATGNVALMQAIGTTDFDFYCGLIGQLVNASKKGDAPEAGTNFMFAVVKGIERSARGDARRSDGGSPYGGNDVRSTPGARREHPATGQRERRL